MNSGVLLMRNTDWMRDLFGQMAHYGTHPMNMTREEVCMPEVPFHQVNTESRRPAPAEVVMHGR